MNKPSSMVTLLLFGLIGSALFSMSFVLYELMSVQGGHWFWSASLRCLFMWGLLSLIIIIQNKGRFDVPMALCRLFFRHSYFWCITGGIGLGTYGWLAFGADYAPAWMITSTYLFTVVASLMVLYFFWTAIFCQNCRLCFDCIFGDCACQCWRGLGGWRRIRDWRGLGQAWHKCHQCQLSPNQSFANAVIWGVACLDCGVLFSHW